MQNKFYGDKRDIVKWGTLIHICRQWKVDMIIQVAFFRNDLERPKLTTNSGDVSIAEEVWSHFGRNITQVRSLGELANISIDVFDMVFDHRTREKYTDAVLARIESIESQPKVVFLDPDTGIAPTKIGVQHVSRDEIRRIWSALKTGDWLVLYQHLWHKKDCRQEARKRFISICGIADVEEFWSSRIAHDVVFLGCVKP